ncbi:PREDICTED: neuralized-like protein 4 [Thamnophis sirtalis]|uniref:Neuralized-like protein 4 n=1 Tax=Thamnophis sirtalis TaxID=35019 RepID=A0A6I9XL81_9SAUR|nr:PREDICTED: neuralized-like protein 4 [Thamnophis sirtalis]
MRTVKRAPGARGSRLSTSPWLNSCPGCERAALRPPRDTVTSRPVRGCSSGSGLKGGSWIISGCSVLRDGRSILEEYGQDLDQLGEGDRVGIQRTANGELRLWVNGQDCGVAATGIPPRVWAVVDLYGKCTQITVVPGNAEEAEEGASRDEALEAPCNQSRPDKFPSSLESENGFSSMELSEVVSNAILSAYNGSLLNVNLGSPPSDSPPGGAPPMTSNDALLFHEKCGTLIKLSNNNKTAERRRPLDEFNNGVVMTNRPLRDNEMFENVFVVLDLYGRVTSVSIVSSTLLEEAEGTHPPSVASEPYSEEEEEPTPGENELPSVAPSMEFLENHGKNILLSNGNLTATRVSSYNQGIVAVAQPLLQQQLFQFQIDSLNPQWTSSLSLGVIGSSPERLNFPATACSLKRSTWLLQRDSVFQNCLKICENYGPNLDTFPEGTVLGVLVDASGCLHLYINGVDQGVAAQDIPSPCYVLLDLYGQCEQCGHSRDGHAYFTEDPKRSLCYCESCHKLRGDEAYYKRGEPPRDYALPFGWCRFSLRINPRLDVASTSKKWHMAYHGTSIGAVRRMLDQGELVPGSTSILSCRPVKADPQGGGTGSGPNGVYLEAEENSVQGREEAHHVVLSPTLRYAGLEPFATKVQFKDPKSHRQHSAQVALQVCVRPGSYKICPPTQAASEPVDPRFSSAEIEWVTKEKGATVLFGLLIRVE